MKSCNLLEACAAIFLIIQCFYVFQLFQYEEKFEQTVEEEAYHDAAVGAWGVNAYGWPKGDFGGGRTMR